MLAIRPTQVLARRLGVTLAPLAQDSTNALGDWYCQLLHTRPKQLVLAVSETSRLPVVFLAAGNFPFEGRLQAAVGEVLLALGVPMHIVTAEQDQMHPVAYAKTINRSVLGTMNEYTFMLHAFLAESRDLREATLWLADVPCGPLQGRSAGDVAVELLGR